MNQEQRTFFLATIESMETTIAAQIKALRAVIALSQNQSYAPVQVQDSIEEVENDFARNIFSITGDE